MDEITKNQKLITAVQKGNQDELMSLIDAGANVNYQDEQGNTPLHWAVKEKKLGILNVLIGKKPDFCTINKEGYSPLVLACKTGRKDIVTTLPNTGMDINKVDPNNVKTALVTAIQGNNLEIVRILLQHNADLERAVADKSPLIWAIEGNSIEIVNILLPKIKNISGSQVDVTPLCQAIQQGNTKIVEILLKNKVDVNVNSVENDLSPLELAVERGLTTVVKSLLTLNKINIQNSNSLLSWATQKKHKDIIITLINKIDTPNVIQFSTPPLLNWAAQNGYTDIAQLLLEKKADVNQEGNDGYSPLHWAAKNGNTDIAQLLLEKNAYIDKNNKDGHSPLALAFMENHKAIIEKLIEKGAEISIKIDQLPLKYWVEHENNDFDNNIKKILNKALEKKQEEDERRFAEANHLSQSMGSHTPNISSKVEGSPLNSPQKIEPIDSNQMFYTPRGEPEC